MTCRMTWRATVLTILPEVFPGALGASLAGKALADGKWALETTNLRRFGEGRHKNVDDTPAGGGAGMVLRADILGAAIDDARRTAPKDRPMVYLSPRGARFDQAMARDWAGANGITLLCGAMDHGQGHGTTFKQVLADKLGIDGKGIQYRFGDTDKVTFGVGTFNARVATFAGSAALFDQSFTTRNPPEASVLPSGLNESDWTRSRCATPLAKPGSLRRALRRWVGRW